jgi:alkylated DNA repair dioxygenase AlkB
LSADLRPPPSAVCVALPDADVAHVPDFLPVDVADRALAQIRAETAWEQHRVRVCGREHRCPRLSAWCGDAGAVYRYSGQTLWPRSWAPGITEIRERVESLLAERFDGVLLNLYRDGRDGMGWHSDDERELGESPTIASVSLGAARRFRLKHRSRTDIAPYEWQLGHGSLIVMRGPTQRHWRHCVPKTRRPVGERVNLSFRAVSTPHDRVSSGRRIE